MITKLKEALKTFFLSNAIVLFSIGKAFANDSIRAGKIPFWEIWIPAIEKVDLYHVAEFMIITTIIVVLFFLRIWYVHRNEDVTDEN